MSFDDSPPIEISSRETSNDNIDNLEDDDAFNHYHENGRNSIEDNMLPDLQKYQSTPQDEDLFSTYESLKVGINIIVILEVISIFIICLLLMLKFKDLYSVDIKYS